jgi:hypothetical protein
MKRIALWIVLVILIVLGSIYAYDRYQQHRMERAVEQWLEQFFGELNEIMVEQDTVCTLNDKSGECTCILETTGAEISKSEKECIELASEASDVNQE